MKLLTIIAAFALFVSCGTDREEPQTEVESNVDAAAAQIKTSDEDVDKEKLDADTVKNSDDPPQKSPVMQDDNEKSISELWNTYKKAKSKVNKALDSNDIEAIVANLAIAGESAEQLGRMDIASWQFNNIGHYSIVEFKRRTEYDHRLQELATMATGSEKTEYLKATKELFLQEYPLLDNAEDYLVRAQIIDDFLEPSRRTEVIQRNIDYIEWVKDFTGVDKSL